MTEYEIIEEEGFKYVVQGEGEEPLVLVHGLMGGLSNFDELIRHFSTTHRVMIPLLPIFELPLKQAKISGLKGYLMDFLEHMKEDRIHLVGNSLGGHLSILYALQFQEKVISITLTGSSGLYENAFGNGFPKREDYEFIKRRSQQTFYDPAIATKELVDELFAIVNERAKALRIITTAKSAIRHNLGSEIHKLAVPVLLIWGKNDTITPPKVGEKFHELLPNSQLVLFDKCGHAPMMERPFEFNVFLEEFIKRIE